MRVKGYGVSFGGDENILKLTVATDARICDYSKSHWIVHIKWVNFMICEYLNNVIFNNAVINILIGIKLGSTDLEKRCMIIILILSIHEHYIMLQLFGSSLVSLNNLL